MDRRTFLGTLTGSVLAAPLIIEAQQVGKIPRVGVLFGSPAASWIQALRDGLRELGYAEGQTVVIEWRSAEGRYERLPNIAGELVRLPVDVLVAHPTIAVHAAKDATTTIPIVMPASADPVGAGLIASLARPGRNVTGSTFIATEISGKRLELLKQVAPEATSVAALANPTNPATALQLQQVQGAARALRVALQILEVRDPSEFDSAFSALARGGAGALLVIDDPMLGSHRTQIVHSVAKRRLPAMYGWKDWVDVGGLVSYGPNVDEMFRRSAVYVDKILKGARPGDLPVEQPTKFELIINLKTAKALGVTIPPSLLLRADQVIE